MRILAATIAALALTSCADLGLSSGPKTAPLEGGRYVAMGSSIASGPGLGEAKPGAPARCLQTFANYPTVLAARLRMTLYDVTCAGAKTDHVLGNWNELAPQINAVTADTRLVTLTIGGNDLGLVQSIMAANCGEDGTTPLGSRRFPCPDGALPDGNAYARFEAQMRGIVQAVKARAPAAQLVIVQYPQLLSEAPCEALPISQDAITDTQLIHDRMTAITARVAQEEGALLVPFDDLSVGHGPCDAEPWVAGDPPGYDGSDGMQWHYNRLGMREAAGAIAAALGR